MNTTNSADERIEKLAAQVRWLRLWAIGATVVPSVAFLVAMQSPQPKELSVERIVTKKLDVVDDDGNVRGTWGPEPRFGNRDISLTMHGPAGTSTRVMLYATHEAALTLNHTEKPGTLYLFADEDSAGMSLLSRGTTNNAGPCFSVSSNAGDARLEMRRMISTDAVPVSGGAKERSLALPPDLGLERRGQ